MQHPRTDFHVETFWKSIDWFFIKHLIPEITSGNTPDTQTPMNFQRKEGTDVLLPKWRTALTVTAVSLTWPLYCCYCVLLFWNLGRRAWAPVTCLAQGSVLARRQPLYHSPLSRSETIKSPVWDEFVLYRRDNRGHIQWRPRCRWVCLRFPVVNLLCTAAFVSTAPMCTYRRKVLLTPPTTRVFAY